MLSLYQAFLNHLLRYSQIKDYSVVQISIIATLIVLILVKTFKRIYLKRILISLLLLTLITSCAHNKIRFVKQPKQEIVKVDTYESSSDDIAEAPAVRKVGRSSNSSQEEIINAELDEETLNSSWNTPEPADSVEIIELKQTKEEIAKNATDDAKKGKNNLLVALLLIPTWIFGGIIISGILINYGLQSISIAKRSRYITKEGERYLKNAERLRKMWIILGSILAAFAIFIVIALAGMG